jgi:nitrogen PTS system EIIA component
MKLNQLLSIDHIIPEMTSKGHAEVIAELVHHLVTTGLLEAALEDEIYQALMVREEQISTGIGNGVAIPHAFSEKIESVSAVFGRSREGVDFQAIDKKPVHLVVLFIVPKKNYHLHLQTLAAIAKMFTNAQVRENLLAAATNAEMAAILSGKSAKAAPSRA